MLSVIIEMQEFKRRAGWEEMFVENESHYFILSKEEARSTKFFLQIDSSESLAGKII